MANKNEPPSPLSGNIMLNELDKELESRGLPFVRYADDAMMFCKSKRVANQVMESITRFIECKLCLKANREKAIVSYARGVKYPGYSLLCHERQMPVHGASQIQSGDEVQTERADKPKQRMGVRAEKAEAERAHKGGVAVYYRLAQMKRMLIETDEWSRRRTRMCIWKAWKRQKARIANLKKCGIAGWQAYQWGCTRLGYWRMADSPILKRAVPNDSLKRAGYANLSDNHIEWHPKNRNRRMRNRMYGGVRGRQIRKQEINTCD